MEWKEILKNVITESILLVATAVVGWFCGLFRGKKISSRAIERKNELYQPLINDIERYTKFTWSIRENVRTPFLSEVVKNAYKYGLDEELKNQCNYLYQVVNEYNGINLVRVAHSIIVKIFECGYEAIYGSIVDGIAYHSDRDGNEWEEEVVAEPVQTIRQMYNAKDIESLLLNEGCYTEEVCVGEENDDNVLIYSQLKRIYGSALRVIVNGTEYKNPTPVIELKMLPEEYMACNYDFFEIYNNDERIKKKYELREEIIYTSQAVVQEIKEIIEKIVKLYEVEEV